MSDTLGLPGALWQHTGGRSTSFINSFKEVNSSCLRVFRLVRRLVGKALITDAQASLCLDSMATISAQCNLDVSIPSHHQQLQLCSLDHLYPAVPDDVNGPIWQNLWVRAIFIASRHVAFLECRRLKTSLRILCNLSQIFEQSILQKIHDFGIST